jgi:hypothetical protein
MKLRDARHQCRPRTHWWRRPVEGEIRHCCQRTFTYQRLLCFSRGKTFGWNEVTPR